MTTAQANGPKPYSELVKPDRVHTALYKDEAIFRDEMEKIFQKTWVWVAHESEIPQPGAFKTSYVGLQPVIVVRTREGEIRVLLNRCRHRGATVCENRTGKTSNFVCPYHGWTYGLDGALRGVPYPEGYNDFDKSNYGLVSLRVESYAGLVFATSKDDIESLSDFLGPAKTWIDLFMKQGAGFGVKTAGEHKFRFPGNWKIQLENTTDAYHFPLVHRSFLNSVDDETGQTFDLMNQGGFVQDLGNGHSVMVMIPHLVDLEEGLDAPIPERFAALADELRRSHPEDVVRRVVRAVGGTGFNLNLFPNLACSMAFFRVLRPVSVSETEISHIAIGMDGGPEAANRARLRIHEHFQGPMGFGSPDDAEAWTRVQRGVEAGPDLWIMLNRSLGVDGVDNQGPGLGDVSAETGMRAAYQMWKRMMCA
ncbi:MAG TPA: aromatic ring-hydroxylating dioxygenase subunit alpha [Caulobacteraceae bacterium]|nr:aromatic ring-hydroxylating dioxygenase subunit alpha [Caulobacteraceae bacterium]